MLSDFPDPPKGESVILSPGEMNEATEHGRRVHRESRKNGRKDESGAKSAAICILGAMGELVVSKLLGVPWEKPINKFKAPDVGEFQVRTAPQSHQGLIFRPADNPDEIFILVTRVNGPHFIVRGWNYGEVCWQEGRITDFGHKERPPAHVLRQERVNNMEELLNRDA